MWPAKNNVGPQLTYGLNGLPVVDSGATFPASGRRLVLLFPRLKNNAPRFHPVQNSGIEISPLVSDDHVKLRHGHLPCMQSLHEEFAAPTPLLDVVDAEANPLHQPRSYDPSKGPISATFTLGTGAYADLVFLGGKAYYPKAKTGMISVHCHAFASDPYTLKVVPMMPKNKNFFHTGKPNRSRKNLFTIPDIKNHAVECRFPFEIHQIESCREHKILVVRGLRHIAVLAVNWENDPFQKGILLKKAFTIVHDPANLAHVALGKNKLVFADCEGAYSVYAFTLNEKWQYELTAGGVLPLYDPADISAWRRLCWPSVSPDHFLFFTRKSVSQIHVKTGASQKLVTFHTWSRAQDFALFNNDLFLLTSQELVWVHVTPEGLLQRLLSWKHYLDNQDMTLKLSACYCETGDFYSCVVYSSQAPLALMFTFGRRDNRPCSLRDPYIFLRQQKAPMFLSVFETPCTNNDVGFLLSVVHIDLSYRLTYTLYSNLENRAFRPHKNSLLDDDILDPRVSEPAPSKLTPVEARTLYKYFAGQIQMQHEMLDLQNTNIQQLDISVSLDDESSDDEVQAMEESEQRDCVQEYAYLLGTDIKPYFENKNVLDLFACRSLATIAESVPTEVKDLEEFERMLEQLRKFYETQDITLLPFDSEALASLGPSFACLDHSIVKTPGAFEKYSKKDTKKAAIILATGLTKAHGDYAQDYVDAIEREMEECHDDIKGTLEEWNLESCVPKKAKSKSASTKSNGKKKTLLRRAIAQNSQQVTDSQPQYNSDSDDLLVSSSDSEDPDSPASSEVLTSLKDAIHKISFSPPRIHTKEESVPKKLSKSLQKDLQKALQKIQPKIKKSQPKSQPASQTASQTASQLASQSSQSIKRPGTQPLIGKKKKKAKGGFA